MLSKSLRSEATLSADRDLIKLLLFRKYKFYLADKQATGRYKAVRILIFLHWYDNLYIGITTLKSILAA